MGEKNNKKKKTRDVTTAFRTARQNQLSTVLCVEKKTGVKTMIMCRNAGTKATRKAA